MSINVGGQTEKKYFFFQLNEEKFKKKKFSLRSTSLRINSRDTGGDEGEKKKESA